MKIDARSVGADTVFFSERLRREAPKTKHPIAARLFLPRVQPFKGTLQLFQLLPSFTELAFRGQALVVGEIFGGFCDEGV